MSAPSLRAIRAARHLLHELHASGRLSSVEADVLAGAFAFPFVPTSRFMTWDGKNFRFAPALPCPTPDAQGAEHLADDGDLPQPLVARDLDGAKLAESGPFEIGERVPLDDAEMFFLRLVAPGHPVCKAGVGDREGHHGDVIPELPVRFSELSVEHRRQLHYACGLAEAARVVFADRPAPGKPEGSQK